MADVRVVVAGGQEMAPAISYQNAANLHTNAYTEYSSSHLQDPIFRKPSPASCNSLTIMKDLTVTYALVVLSAAIFTLYVSRHTIRSQLPLWLRPFAQEQAPDGLKRKFWSIWTYPLLLISIAGLVLSFVPVIINPSCYVYLWEMAPWAIALFITTLDRPTKTPRILLIQYVSILGASTAIYAIRFLDRTLFGIDLFRLARVALCLLSIIIIGFMPIREPSWGNEDIGQPGSQPSHNLRSPEDDLCLFSFWSMSWVNPLAKACRKREITEEDVWQLPFEFQHTRLYMAFRELKGKLLLCLIEANGLDLSIATSLAIAERVAEVSNIRLTSKLYSALDSGNPADATFWCGVMLALDAFRQLCKTTSGWYSRKSYERSRGEAFIALFGKLLTRAVPGSDITEKGPDEEHPQVSNGKSQTFIGRMFGRSSGSSKQKPRTVSGPASNAKVVNLVRGDTYEISQRFWDFSKLVSQPIKVIVTMYYLIDIMGWPSAIGFGLMIVFLAVNSALVRKLIKLERQRTAFSDKRAQAVSHFVEASRPLKLNGWTSSWSARIMKFRALEMAKRLNIAHVTAGISTVSVTGGTSYPLASIALYTLILKQGLPNDVIWPSLQLFSQLEMSVKEAFDLISAYWKSTIPIERVNKYMSEPDRDDISNSPSSVTDIEFRDASFSWPSTGKLILRDINLKLSKGLTVIRGKVGSGKSSLLLAALNEMELHEGDLIRPDVPVAYCQQLPWLQNKTIRENIVFHQHFDSTRYRQVLHACALLPDLASLPDGDQTKLEEGGIGLSGGQKARVALARAVYSHCKILLLDDPLAALDHDTASAIVRRFLQGPLAEGRTIAMVTHRDDLVLRIADQVVDLDDGEATVLSEQQVKEELEHPYHEAGTSAHDDVEASHEIHAEDIAVLKDAPEEPSKTGSVSLSVYAEYMKAGGWHLWIFLAIAYGLSRFCDISRARLLEAWGADSVGNGSKSSYWGLPNAENHPQAWILVLSGLSGGQILTYAIAQLLLARISVKAAQGLFKAAIDKVSRATFRYHDTTPTGQLKNRLIADMGMVDGGIVAPLESFVFNLIALVMSLVAIATHQPLLLVILAVVAVLFMYFFRIYVPVSRCLRRMEMRYLTPIIANIGVMQDGLVTIRALRVEQRFQDRHLDAVDDFQKQDHFFWSMAFWLDFRLSFSSIATRTALILFMVWRRMPASAIGFVLTQTNIAMAAVQQLCERFAQLQLDAVSLERVNMLNQIPEEPKGDHEPPEGWPRPSDDVKFEQISFKYDDHLPSVLDKVSFEIPGGSTCAVLGRTGSGKSTIANALLMTQAPFEGTLKIGSVDLSQIDRTALRNRVTFIQQDPTLFPGTLRDNIDPAADFSDAECENAIHRVLGAQWSLDSPIDAAGKNLSQGQRQLVGIARAVLRRSGLVILDEATASIDRATAATVQRILRSELSNSTVITIAHRLEAVEDATWCLRLDHGRVVECGPARDLAGSQDEE
ncbi:pleiotropic ABC efflux transporter of multiple drugs YBT1 [Trichoderma asperellum]|uniref:Pleiotropic ABC efflux transporter of multiple drugs YBT1 n=1 Tax=Trichoderma asperellum TaxID=101201 RepID=A0A6V8QHH4_TRIAP|nr:multidrug-resistance associated protein [Trichoderma asperelloides]GFP51905.1 pleiotropic ABC efflux transporter of multiple drugs YBT1 [Trichoderma asperellum]